MGRIKAVFFDVGGTLIDESRMWRAWADAMGVAQQEFFAALGAVIARGEHHRQVFELLRPGFDVEAFRRQRPPSGERLGFAPGDLYPDALPCLAQLRARGLTIGISGNTPRETADVLRAAGVQADVIASSAAWGIEKPSEAFFARLTAEAGHRPSEIAYVGDRLDNDVLPAARAGLGSVFLRRGPWGVIHARLPEAAEADLVIDGLAELPDRLSQL